LPSQQASQLPATQPPTPVQLARNNRRTAQQIERRTPTTSAHQHTQNIHRAALQTARRHLPLYLWEVKICINHNPRCCRKHIVTLASLSWVVLRAVGWSTCGVGEKRDDWLAR
jgi:hypothetical protein